ncbi:F-box/FBD/LRR-repeat protein At1g13570-like [Nicotiana tomentosiformis]|uniref:F-box/FBD/LRR-repeat protein At1g13570-like n=1 Tax=Nicotiana tomentosiformis TaxID=4098 RepID=UPI00051C44C4|nr:F-box/FBD/LRR-repeat protein At1g13570-like [Nicotiana tomentosiformis]
MFLVIIYYMMPPKGRKRCRSLLPDVLSNLLDNVVDVILMYLPCKDAVRTSILSTKWRYNWCRRTKLTLDESHWRTKNDRLDHTVKFKKIINQFLALHEGPITKFTLKINSLKRCPKIDNFICFLSRNEIRYLVLHLPREKPYKLPSSLFTCSQLSHLTLHDCSINPSSAFKGFDKLISLELCRVTISSEFLESLISHCLLLEQFVLEIPEVVNRIEINASKLRSFDFTGCVSSIYLKNVPLLEKVSLIGDESSMEAENFGFAKSCSALEHLIFNYSYNEMALDEQDEVATRLPFEVNSIKRFYLPHLRALCLIRSFPHLEYLEIEVGNEYDITALECLEMERFSDVTFNHLREVKIKCFTGTTPEIQLIKLLFAKSPLLLRMLIDTWFLDHKFLDTRLDTLAEISKFWRASPKAEVVYIDCSLKMRS